MKLTVDILEDFINVLSLSGRVLSFSDDGTNTTIMVETTFHARRKMNISIDGTDYEIVSVVNNESIEVVGVIANPVIYTVPNPFYFHGTPVMTNSHINGANHSDKVPMVYLYEILRERDLRENSRIRREADLRLFFLDSANFSDWSTDDHYSQRLLGLNNLVDFFIAAARAYTCCFYLFDTDFTRVNHVNWGVYQDNEGHKQRIFDDELTGVELSFTLPIKGCNGREKKILNNSAYFDPNYFLTNYFK